MEYRIAKLCSQGKRDFFVRQSLNMESKKPVPNRHKARLQNRRVGGEGVKKPARGGLVEEGEEALDGFQSAKNFPGRDMQV